MLQLFFSVVFSQLFGTRRIVANQTHPLHMDLAKRSEEQAPLWKSVILARDTQRPPKGNNGEEEDYLALN